MTAIIRHDNGFIRESESDRAKFDHLSKDEWENIGSGGKVIDKKPTESIGHLHVTEVGIVDTRTNYVHDFHFDREFLVEIEKHMHMGSIKYERDNWRKARNLGRIFNAIIRHAISSFINPDDVGDRHEAAIAINALIMWNAKRKLYEEKQG